MKKIIMLVAMALSQALHLRGSVTTLTREMI